MVLTVSADRKTRTGTDPALKSTADREYTMNGNIVHEWTGQPPPRWLANFIRQTAAGDCGNVCHAVAIARTNDEQNSPQSRQHHLKAATP